MNTNFLVDENGCIQDKANYKPNLKNKYGRTNKYLENLEKFKNGGFKSTAYKKGKETLKRLRSRN